MNGDVPLHRYWGKLRKEDGRVVEWHPLVDHCLDVAACASTLLREPTWNRRLARLGGRETLDEPTVAALAIVAGLHDVGKAGHGFQDKVRHPPGTGHVSEALVDLDLLSGAIGGDLVAEEGAREALCFAIAHHGGPPAYPEIASDRCRWRPGRDRDPLTEIRELRGSLDAAFPGAVFAGIPVVPQFLHAWSGLVMLADWLGSDSRAFPYTREADGPRGPSALGYARELLGQVGITGLRRTRGWADHRRGRPVIRRGWPDRARANGPDRRLNPCGDGAVAPPQRPPLRRLPTASPRSPRKPAAGT